MPYSTKEDVEFYGHLDEGKFTEGYDYPNSVAKAINAADSAIDDYLMQPRGFFEGGGVEIEKEYHDGVEVGRVNTWVRFFGSRRDPKLRLKYTPVLSVTTLEEETSAGTWTSRTEGRGNDFLVLDDGVRFLRNVPCYDYKNVRVTYKAGYTQTPSQVQECSARLAAAILHLIQDSASRMQTQQQGMSANLPEIRLLSKRAFSPVLQNMVQHYRRHVPVRATS